MGVFGALNTAVSGLRSQAFALENISGNIANAQTTGFKRQDTSFFELISDIGATQASQASGSVNFASRATNEIQGNIQAADQDTFIAINGDGYFVVEEATGVVDGETIFGGGDLYTRAGDFQLSREGFFQNGSGYFLKGFSLDPITGNRTGSVPELIQVNTDLLPATPTTQISYRANLPSFPRTTSADVNIANSELLAPTLQTAGVGNATISATDAQLFIETSISGGAITGFDSLGNAVDVQLRFAKTDSTSAAPAVTGLDTYNLYYLSDSGATGAATAFTRVNQQYVFDSTGQLNPAITGVSIPNLTVDGNNLGTIQLNHGSQGITQFANANGVVDISELSQNGIPAGEFLDVAINDGGRLSATYSNGQIVDIAEIALASFNADSGLRRIDGGGAFAATAASGIPILEASGFILGSALEASNTDIADEFTKLIVTQQAYTANSRVITASDDLLTEVINIIR
ncbi:MAG: flagellar hook-basal body complex protein [Rhizobiales bacterium]|nr:flagellar hook-basal body complex protein [Hyphomicrobiales bacterium]